MGKGGGDAQREHYKVKALLPRRQMQDKTSGFYGEILFDRNLKMIHHLLQSRSSHHEISCFPEAEMTSSTSPLAKLYASAG